MTRREHVPADLRLRGHILDREDPGRGLLLQPFPRVPLEGPGLFRELRGRHRAGSSEGAVEPQGVAEVDRQHLRHPEAR